MGRGSRSAICVCGDPDTSRIVGAALANAGLSVDHQVTLPDELGEIALLVIDRATRQRAGFALLQATVPVVVVGDDLDDDSLIALMLEAPVSHLVENPGDRDLGITSEKVVSGDLFGLEKYVDDVRVGERVVANDAEKRLAMGEVCTWAEANGARRPIVHRIASVVDELLMNALHDAPRESGQATGEPTTAVLRWACDDHTLAISVGDCFGALRQRDVIDHVRRARGERGRPETDHGDAQGAGLGLYLVLANVASLIVNVEPGRRTEVVCLFDLAGRDRRAVTGIRSLHVFS